MIWKHLFFHSNQIVLEFRIEMGFIVGKSTKLGERISTKNAV